jgi:hypothetical protein
MIVEILLLLTPPVLFPEKLFRSRKENHLLTIYLLFPVLTVSLLFVTGMKLPGYKVIHPQRLVPNTQIVRKLQPAIILIHLSKKRMAKSQ